MHLPAHDLSRPSGYIVEVDTAQFLKQQYSAQQAVAVLAEGLFLSLDKHAEVLLVISHAVDIALYSALFNASFALEYGTLKRIPPHFA